MGLIVPFCSVQGFLFLWHAEGQRNTVFFTRKVLSHALNKMGDWENNCRSTGRRGVLFDRISSYKFTVQS